jgi:hypothetical protein
MIRKFRAQRDSSWRTLRPPAINANLFHFMNSVARCYCAGLPLAALARLGGAVEKSPQDARRAAIG